MERFVSFLMGAILLGIFGPLTGVIIWAVYHGPKETKPWTMDLVIMRIIAFMFSEMVIAIALFALGMVLWGLFKPTWVSHLFVKFTGMLKYILGVMLLGPPLFLIGVCTYTFFFGPPF